MAKVVNTFVKGKLNKDLDARLVPNGEYRDARNVQVSKSEGPDVGELENVLGNKITGLTFPANSKCIGWVTDDTNNFIYLFVTDNKTEDYVPTGVGSNHHVYQYNVLTDTYIDLIYLSPFLNFSQLYPIYGINIVENLLFWTDNRNQPRKINIERAVDNNRYYTTEDQISVAKYNPYQAIQLWQQRDENNFTAINTDKYESTMKNVTSKTTPIGFTATAPGASAGSSITITPSTAKGVNPVTGQSISYIATSTTNIVDTPATVSSYNASTGVITCVGTPATPAGAEIIIDANPYYDGLFAGDPAYLEDKFVRFSYRWRFDDNEYSIMAPFTQVAFIPKQDGYFMYIKQETPAIDKDDQAAAYRSTIVEFVENKVDEIKLIIPLPFNKFSLQDKLKIKEIDILYKESDGVAVRVIDTIPIEDIFNSSARAQLGPTPVTAPNKLNLINVIGTVKTGELIGGKGVANFSFVDSYNSTTGILTCSKNQASPPAAASQYVYIGNPSVYEYKYNSIKPFRTLPESELLRVFDKTPVKALAQEISGNRVIYGNFENKHTPPSSLDYNVQASDKNNFKVINAKATSTATATYTAGTNIPITLVGTETPSVGDVMYGWQSSTIYSGDYNGFPLGQVTSYSSPNIKLDKNVILVAGQTLVFQDAGTETDNTSKVEYPNSSLKQNRNYQVGVVLSDRYGRQSSVILSNNKESVTVGSSTFIGDTVYSAYLEDNATQESFPGDSLKIRFNNPISSGYANSPGLYNDDTSSVDYNPLGWYSYKIVVKQTEQEYYNVYFPGIMASYPQTGQGDTIVPTGGVYLAGNPITLNDPRGVIQEGGIVSSETAGVTIPEGTKITNVTLTSFLPSSITLDKNVTLVNDTNLFITPSTVKEFGQTSHAVLINDNINKVPRDLSQVGPDQKQYRSSVRLFGRVENTNTLINYNTDKAAINLGKANTQYYPGRKADTVSTISTMYDLFDYNPLSPPRPNDFPQFYLFESNPLIARISTENKIGQLSTTNYITVSGTILTGGNFDASDDIDITSYTGPLFENYIIRGAGIPEGTYITSISASSPSGSPLKYRIKLNNAITIVDDQQVEFTRGFSPPHQGEDIIPGLEYLAVYETSPVISNLDIYWETTTSGLISDLNSLILSESSGGAGIDSFDVAGWTEGLATTSNILASAFKVVDQFGVDVSDPVDANLTQLDVTIDSVTDNNNPGNDVSSYFTLTRTGTPGSTVVTFMVKTTTDYYSSVYFSNDENARLFNFIFKIVTTYNSFTSEVFVSATNNAVGPGNVQPQITTAGNTPITTNRTITTALTTIDSHNGANNTALRTLDYNVAITNITKNGNPLEEGELLSDYFTITNSVVASQIQTKLFIASPTIDVADYDITLQFADAGESINPVYEVNLNRASNVSNYEKTTYYCDSPDNCNKQYVVRFRISSSPIGSEDGYYYYGAIPCTNPDDATQQLSNGTTTITIDKTNANPSSGGGQGNALYFSATSFAAAEALYLAQPPFSGNDCLMPSEGGDTGLGTFVTEDISAYAVEII